MNVLIIPPEYEAIYTSLWDGLVEFYAEKLISEGHTIKCPSVYGNEWISKANHLTMSYIYDSFDGDISDIDMALVINYKNYINSDQDTLDLINTITTSGILTMYPKISEIDVQFIASQRKNIKIPKLTYGKNISRTPIYGS